MIRPSTRPSRELAGLTAVRNASMCHDLLWTLMKMLIPHRAQHVRCDGIRPVCKRCHQKGHACVYVFKTSPWTVYTDAGEDMLRETDAALTISHPNTASSFPQPHTKRSTSLNSVALPSKSGHPGPRHVHTRNQNTYSGSPLHSSLDIVPGRENWLDIRVDVHELMNYCKTCTPYSRFQRLSLLF